MGYITCTAQTILLLIAAIVQVFAITTRLDHEVSPSRNFRRHIGTLPFPDWELGLREAVYQALLRERNLHPNLREFLYSAPIIGHQDSATPFGDIVILARGQLYSAPGGFQFVQDPYKNDCDECHNAPPRCDRAPCENWRPEGHERLLALWTVKRIRHRDSNHGYRYELEYKVSPMNIPVDEPFVTRNGRFDYSMPGHTFIVKSSPREYESPYQSVNSRHDKVYRSSNPNEFDSNSWSPNFGPNYEGRYLPPPPLPPAPPAAEEYFDEDPRKDGYPNVLYGPPHIYTTKRPQLYEDDEEAEKEIFNKLFNTLSSTEQAALSTASTQHIYSPTMTTKTSPQPTIPTTPHFPSKTTTSHSSYQPTSAQAPLLPTIPIQNSFDGADIFAEKILTTHKDEAVPTKPASTVRFPTPTTSYFTTPTMRFPGTTGTVRYSEPDPLYMNSVTPTRPTLTSQFYPTRTTKKYKTTPSDDYDIFGEPGVVQKQTNGMKFPGEANIRQPPGEQVITVVRAPTIVSKDETLFNTERSQPSRPSPKYHVNFSNTQQLPPGGESYITVDLHPSTRGQQQSTLPTLNRESSSGYEVTTKSVEPQRTFTPVEPITTSINNHVKLTTEEYTGLNAGSGRRHEKTVTVRPFSATTTIQETAPFTRTTGKITRTTSPQTSEMDSSSYAITPTNLPTVLTSLTSRVTHPISQSTRTYPPLTRTYSPSTRTYSPSTRTYSPSTRTYSPSTRTYSQSTKETSASTNASSPSTKAASPSTRRTLPSIKETTPSTKRTSPSTKGTSPSTKESSPSTTESSPSTTETSSSIKETSPYITETLPSIKETSPYITETLPSIKETSPSTKETSPSYKTYLPSAAIRTTSRGGQLSPKTTATSRDKITPTQTVTTRIDEASTYTSSTASGTLINYPMPPDSIITSTFPSQNADTTIISTASIHDSDFTTMTANLDASTAIPSTNIPQATRKSTRPTRLPTITIKSTLPVTYTTPILTSLESTTPISTHLTTTLLMKIPPRTASSTTQATEDIFGKGNEDGFVSKSPKEKPQSNDFDLDIFGKPQEKLAPKDGKRKQADSFNSKEIDDIFGSEPVKKQPIRDDYNDYESPESTTNKVKIIYSGFFSPSTSSSANKATTTTFKEEDDGSAETISSIEATDSLEVLKNKTEPRTSQSYSTSVSVEVNKRNEITTPLGSDETTLKSVTTQPPCNATEKHEEIENNKVLNMLTLSVVNHAKSIDILSNSNNIDDNNNNSNNSTVRDRRYKRKRTYRIQKIRRHNPKT